MQPALSTETTSAKGDSISATSRIASRWFFSNFSCCRDIKACRDGRPVPRFFDDDPSFWVRDAAGGLLSTVTTNDGDICVEENVGLFSSTSSPETTIDASALPKSQNLTLRSAPTESINPPFALRSTDPSGRTLSFPTTIELIDHSAPLAVPLSSL